MPEENQRMMSNRKRKGMGVPMMPLRGNRCYKNEFGEELIYRKPKQGKFPEKQNIFIKENVIIVYCKAL